MYKKETEDPKRYIKEINKFLPQDIKAHDSSNVIISSSFNNRIIQWSTGGFYYRGVINSLTGGLSLNVWDSSNFPKGDIYTTLNDFPEETVKVEFEISKNKMDLAVEYCLDKNITGVIADAAINAYLKDEK